MDKIIIYCIFGSVPMCLVLFVTYNLTFGPSTRQVIIQNDSLEMVSGVVDTVYNDALNHNIRTAILTDKTRYQIIPEWENKIEEGDSLYKAKGSFLLEIYKREGKKIVLDYRSTIPSQ
ncbi:hypothetical protein SAMN05192574_106314 [Mucilaginibacter gossypiicola]|uniref:Uncharacterized protein n=1 Tax=Mucilaginibacter gossypiicola TaxID=551995 RepID=A0A1H8N9P0_9SPHI|nr:hypothetical protein [Mucilaginibacter gossypiicola]SEO26169.1 hypothetical protein SAMN05192574_106314 [Mucilaginibacter gossypiicola]